MLFRRGEREREREREREKITLKKTKSYNRKIVWQDCSGGGGACGPRNRAVRVRPGAWNAVHRWRLHRHANTYANELANEGRRWVFEAALAAPTTGCEPRHFHKKNDWFNWPLARLLDSFLIGTAKGTQRNELSRFSRLLTLARYLRVSFTVSGLFGSCTNL